MPPRRRILSSTARPATLAAAAGAGADYGRSDEPDWRALDWRVHLRAVTVGGRRVHLVDVGSGAGPAVLFIHGLGGRWQSWIENIPRVAASHRAVAFDLPGFGRSQLPVEPITIEAYAAVIQRLCDLLELESLVVVGNSMGGAVAIAAALELPELVRATVLVSPAAISLADFNPAPAAAVLAALSRTPLGSPQGMHSILRRSRARHLAFAALVRHPTLIATDTLSELIGGRGAPGLAGAIEAMLATELGASVGEVSQPVLIVQGREDMLVPLRLSRRLADELPNARLEVLEDTGHLPMIERPARFNELLLDFVAEV
ncbi:MAG TPA: alpha/beta fold hydrolase [Solirubrobacteraceae bacterium]